YNIGTVISGYVGQDTVILGGISVKNITFGLALVDAFNTIYEEDGILGLSRQIGEVTNPGLIQAMNAKNLLKYTIIGFHLGRHKLKTTDKSFMNLGGIDVNAYIGNIIYNNIINQTQFPGTWMILLSDAQVDGISIGGINLPALIDTGSPPIIGKLAQ
ncbi:13684_t:CDS:2, partial [Racocetra persica]